MANKQRKPNKVYDLAMWWAKLRQREVDKIDLAHAKSLLKENSERSIMGCISAMLNGLLGSDVPENDKANRMAMVRWGEPPFIQRWFNYLKDPPPIYMEESYRQWAEYVAQYAPQQVVEISIKNDNQNTQDC